MVAFAIVVLELPTKYPREDAKPIMARIFIYWNLQLTEGTLL